MSFGQRQAAPQSVLPAAQAGPMSAAGRAAWLLLPLLLASLPAALWSSWPGWLGPADFADPLPLSTLAGRLGLMGVGLLLAAGLSVARHAWRGVAVPWPLAERLLWAACAFLVLRASGWLPTLVPFDSAGNLLPYAVLLLGVWTGRRQPQERAQKLLQPLLVGLAALTALSSAAALLTASSDRELGLAGVLGNSGPSTQLALPGAIAGLWLLARGHGGVRLLAAIAVGGFIAHSLWAPAWGALLALALAGLALGAERLAGLGRRAAQAILVLFLILAALALARTAGRLGPVPAPDQRPQVPAAVEHWSGVDVRLLLWSSAPGFYASQGTWLGLDRRSFQVCYEAVRDPRERVLSDAASGGATSVEHLHNDWLQAGFDLGFVLGGVALCAGVWLAVRAWRGLKSADGQRAALCAVLLGLLVLSLQHTPLTRTTPVSWLTGVLIGLVIWPSTALPTLKATRAQPWLLSAGLLLLAALLIQPALGLTLQGHRLAAALTSTTPAAAPAQETKAAGLATPSPAAARFLPTAFSERFTAPLALSLALLAETQREPALELARRLDVLRPTEANAQAQIARAGLVHGDLDGARLHFERALTLDPRHRVARFNLTRLLLEHGPSLKETPDNQQLLELFSPLTALEARGLLLDAQRHGWLSPVAIARLLLAAQLPEPAAGTANEPALTADQLAAGAAVVPGLAEQIDALASAMPEESDERATLRSLAHHLWARGSMHNGEFEDALRSFRQALRQSRWAGRGGSWLIRAELAAAARLAGREAEAQAEAPAADEVRAHLLPIWVR
jgi:tetratricopeptide (TPR) repeat protein